MFITSIYACMFLSSQRSNIDIVANTFLLPGPGTFKEGRQRKAFFANYPSKTYMDAKKMIHVG